MKVDADIGFADLDFDFPCHSLLPRYILARLLTDYSLKIGNEHNLCGVLEGVVIRNQSVAFFLDCFESESLN
jgi:hypothetical protein